MNSVAGVLAGFMAFLASLFGVHAPLQQGHTATTTNATSSAQIHTPVQQNSGVSAKAADTFDVTRIPLGDGKVSTSPEVGYVYSCTTSFRGGGAAHTGGWIHGDTWNLNEKVAVSGSIAWPNAVFSAVVEGARRFITGNGLPTNSRTGVFPIKSSDLASAYDRNPNSIEAQDVSYALPANPTFAASASCVPMGAIGIALNGVAIYNALDDAGRDAVAHETQDSCDGHPQSAGEYHYHGPSSCMPNATKRNTIVGYALDGFPITSMYDAAGHYYTDADLDACHGMTSTYTDASGNTKTGYHYVLTQEYPYTIGCFKGTPVLAHAGGGANTTRGAQQQGNTQGPPSAAISACTNKQANATCAFTTPQGQKLGTCRTTPDNTFACIPL